MGRHKSKPNPSRIIKLADQIQKDLAILIQREFDMSRVGMITLTGVDLTVDYAQLARGIALTHLIEQVNRPSVDAAPASTAPEDPDEQP
jgi:ribosome-binding factor A